MRSHWLFLALAGLGAIAAAGPAVAAEVAAEAGVVEEAPATAPHPEALSPMMQEILSAWDAHALAVAALERSIEAATDPMEANALQLRVESLREQVEIQILGIQAHHARLAGRLEQAAEIEAAIEAMLAPPPVAEPVGRRPERRRGE